VSFTNHRRITTCPGKLPRQMASRSVLAQRALALLPLIGLVELGAHLWQTQRVVPDSDWQAARDVVKESIKPDDLIAFAPRWTDPIGRHVFGDELATLPRVARADVERFPRAFEVSIRGGRDPELTGWKVAGERKTGRVTVRTLENPSYVPVLDDLLAHVSEQGMTVTRRDPRGEHPCPWGQGASWGGGLGAGPGTPRERFNCPGGFVGISVIADLDYYGRRCLYAPPAGGRSETVITFRNVKFGDVIHGHHGLYVEAERMKEGADITLSFRSGEQRLGKVVHRDGEGWKSFDLPTAELKGQTADLVAEVTSASGSRRMYCFEGITR
jgi:hypothetical protein